MADVRQMTTIGLLAAAIFVSGCFKLPGLVAGTEFQLSAPLAVAICAVYGFRRYITAGIIASVIGLGVGSQSLLGVFIALIFRLTVGGVLAVTGVSWLAVSIAGPLGSAVGRLCLTLFVGKAAIPLLLSALPGMLFTMLTAWPLTIALQRVKNLTDRRLTSDVQR